MPVSLRPILRATGSKIEMLEIPRDTVIGGHLEGGWLETGTWMPQVLLLKPTA